MGKWAEKVIDGKKYVKPDNPSIKFWTPVGDDGPLVCECGNSRLHVNFGRKRVFGTCPVCDHKELMYLDVTAE